MEKRTATLQRVFRDADVAGELFDVHLQYQHTILLGEHHCFVGVLEGYGGVGSWRSETTTQTPALHTIITILTRPLPLMHTNQAT